MIQKAPSKTSAAFLMKRLSSQNRSLNKNQTMKTHSARSATLAALALAITTTSTALAAAPSFSLAWSEYPSWSVFGVANELKLIDAAEGKLGPIEKKWNVDIVLKEAEYDPCLTMYGAAQCDAV